MSGSLSLVHGKVQVDKNDKAQKVMKQIFNRQLSDIYRWNMRSIYNFLNIY